MNLTCSVDVANARLKMALVFSNGEEEGSTKWVKSWNYTPIGPQTFCKAEHPLSVIALTAWGKLKTMTAREDDTNEW